MVSSQASNIQIIEPIVVIISSRDTHSPSNVPQSRFVSDICKRSVAIIVVQSALRFSTLSIKINRQAIHKVNIKIPIIVIIEEGNASTHGLHQISFFSRGDVFEV